MKLPYFLLFFVTVVLSFTGCKVGHISQSQGLPDQGYLLFVSDHKSKDVDVTVDGKRTFQAKVVKENKHTVKGNTYAIGTGKKHILVKRDGITLYDRTLFISTQQTKKIVLP